MVVTLPEDLIVSQAAALRSLLLSALESGQPVELDGGSVKEVDAAGLQVLCAARRSALARGISLGFVRTGRSLALIDAIELAGMGMTADDAWLRGRGAPCPSAS